MRRNPAKTYDPKAFEDRIYEMWEKSGSFKAERDPDKKPFTIVMPPPNITGQLHMGHALDHTLQDILIRYKRMQGFNALWLPGTDHASIATEVKVVNSIMEEEGKTKDEIGRDEFLKRAWEWKEKFGGKITEQCRKLGDSCDWDRERFTMDEGCNKAVKHYFVDLYNKGLIYRGNRLINWCPECGTSLSDAEVEHRDIEGSYWYFRYPAVDKKGKDIIIATSRPETMFGDIAIAVHPSDERYKDMVGQKVILPIVGREIPIIADPYPDPEKGTGAVKITPAHDPNDFEVGMRHDLEIISCIDEDANMTEAAGKYQGMDRYECRKLWVKDLEEAGYLVKTEKLTIPVGECYRCHTVIEPMLSDQWFVKMKPLAKPAIEALESGKLNIIPERFGKVYLNWLNDIRDWCISRQLWWGHRIPAWYCKDCGKIIVSLEEPTECPDCKSKNLYQDPDVLDTWFSSALWPLSTLGWPDETEDLKYFYPTDILVTAYDIIFFWVVRMVFTACEISGVPPFHHVGIHGLVRDEEGRKMSKSLGNGIDPLEIIDKYGADALRFTLATGITPGNDMRFTMDRLEASRNFANKLWNASRFVIMNISDEEGNFLPITEIKADDYPDDLLFDEDKWIIARIKDTSEYMEKAIERFDIALAGKRIYDLVWNEFCDWYIEFSKKRLYGNDEEGKSLVRGVLLYALRCMLKMLHPYMPFITEEIWGYLPQEKETENAKDNYLISAAWPKFEKDLDYDREVQVLETAMETVKAIRNIRAEAGAGPAKKVKAKIVPEDKMVPIFEHAAYLIEDAANLSGLYYVKSDEKKDLPKDAMTAVVTGAEIFVALEDLVDFEDEKKRLEKEEKRLEKEVKRASGKLKNKGFVSKAPEAIVEKEREKLFDYEKQLTKVQERLAMIRAKLKED